MNERPLGGSPIIPKPAQDAALKLEKLAAMQVRLGPPTTQAFVTPRLTDAGAMLTLPFQATIPADATNAADVILRVNELFATLRLGIGRTP